MSTPSGLTFCLSVLSLEACVKYMLQASSPLEHLPAIKRPRLRSRWRRFGKKSSISLVSAACSAEKHLFISSVRSMFFSVGFKGIFMRFMGFPLLSSLPLSSGSGVSYKYLPLSASINGAAYSAYLCMYILYQLANPKKPFSPLGFLISSHRHCAMAEHFKGSGNRLPSLNMWPTHFTYRINKKHLEGLTVNPASARRWKHSQTASK